MSFRFRLLCSCLAVFLLSLTAVPPLGAQEKPPEASQDMPRGYSMPGPFPFYSAPPVQFRDNRILVVVFRTAPEILRELVPEPLLPNPAGFMFVYIGDLNIEDPPVGRLGYLEAGIGIPSLYPKTRAAGNYAVCLYLDKALPIVAGREVWGWPKKDAEITFTEKDGVISGRVRRFGTDLMSVSGKLRTRLGPGSGQPQMPWFLQKLIPSARKSAPPDVWQIVSSNNINNTTQELWNCAAEIEFGTGPLDPLGNIKVLEVVSAQFSVGDFVMDYGEVLHDYLGEKKR